MPVSCQSSISHKAARIELTGRHSSGPSKRRITDRKHPQRGRPPHAIISVSICVTERLMPVGLGHESWWRRRRRCCGVIDSPICIVIYPSRYQAILVTSINWWVDGCCPGFCMFYSEQISQLSQRDRAAECIGWVVEDGVGQTILCTKRCRCQKTKSIFYRINPFSYEKRSLGIFDDLFGGLGATYAVHLRFIGKLVVVFY